MLSNRVRVRPRSVSGAGGLTAVLADLYREQLAQDPGNPYLRSHARPRCVANQVRTFDWFAPHLPPAGAVLDWGCQHAPDSCLLRARFADRYDLHACDFVAPGCYPVFREYAGAAYAQLAGPVALPYPDRAFAAVIGSGVLEHAAQDYESLKELYRVMRPDGVLVLTYLPNRLSAQEWVRRAVLGRDFHRRLYGLGEARQLLKRAGFYPVAADYHTFFWDRLLPAPVRRPAARLFPVQVFSSTLRLIARKVDSM